MLFPTLGPSSLPVVVAQPDVSYVLQTEQLLSWSGMTDIEQLRAYYNIWFKRSGSNAKENFSIMPFVSYINVIGRN